MQSDHFSASAFVTDPQSWDRYSYTRNNPVNRIDKLGLEDDPVDPCPTGDCPEDDPITLTGTAYALYSFRIMREALTNNYIVSQLQ